MMKAEVPYNSTHGLTLHGYLSKFLTRSWQDLGTILANVLSRSCKGIHFAGQAYIQEKTYKEARDSKKNLIR